MSKHGVFIQEEATALTVPVTGNSSVQVVIGTAPINLVEDPSKVVNTPILAQTAAEAKKLLGFSDDFANYSLCQSMYATGDIFPVGPVVYINVLDPSNVNHVSAVAAADHDVADGQVVLTTKGMLNDTNLVVKTTAETPATLVKGTDYTVSFDNDGDMVITLIAGSTYASETALNIAGKKLNPAGVVASDIVGSVNASTGAESGCEVIRQVYPKLGIVPGLILAPGWSQNATVGIALAAKAALINGVFKAMALVDLDTGSGKARKYTDVKTVKESSGFTSKFMEVLWPCYKVGTYILAKSAVDAALAAYTDANNDDVPSISPSNKLLGVTGLCLADGTEVLLDQDQASTVNSYGVVTAINLNGWRNWGNYTGAYPGSGDAKDIWIAVRRMFNWQGNNFILTYFDKVDDPMNYRLIESIVDSENIRCAAYAPDKWAGARIEYLAEDNPTTDILDGKITFRQHIAPYTPAQEIENILSYDTDMLAEALGGE